MGKPTKQHTEALVSLSNQERQLRCACFQRYRRFSSRSHGGKNSYWFREFTWLDRRRVATHYESRQQAHGGALLDYALRWFVGKGV